MTSRIASPAAAASVPTPAGPFTAVALDGLVLASGWTADADELLALVHPSLRPERVRRVRRIDRVTDAVIAYHDGDLAVLDGIAVLQRSGPFREHAWEVLRKVEPGQPITYAEYAARCGNPAAVRAAAGACARNAAALFVPCHRIVRTGGGLGGFRWGLPVKEWLLAHEARAAG